MTKTITIRIKTSVDFNEQIMSTVSIVRDGYVMMMSVNSYVLDGWERLETIADD